MNNLSNNQVIHIKKGDTEYLQFRKLLEYPEIQHCYTLRKNKLSFLLEEKDDIQLQESYNKISEAVGFNKDKIIQPKQTHTDKVENVVNKDQVFSDIDGLITNKREITLCTTSADCIALLFYDPMQKVIADVHSGWRGTVQKIGQNAVLKMIKEYNCKPENIICCICPCIGKCHFEVDEDVKDIFYNTFKYMKEMKENKIIKKGRLVKEGNKTIQKYNIDTTLINRIIQRKLGLKEENIIDTGICTVCNSKQFHSYRTDREKAGRNAAMICIK